MNSDFVENSTKKFVINTLFPIFNEKANKNEDIIGLDYFRILGFGIVVQACIGKELTGINDEFYKEFNKMNELFRIAGTKQFWFDTLFG